MIGIFLDTETNGLNPYKNRILEIAFKITDILTGDIIDSYEEIIFQPEEVWERSDKKSLEINGFTWEMVAQGAKETTVAAEIIEIFHKHHLKRKISAFICQNPSFDRVFFSQLIAPEKQDKLGWPYHWLDLASMFWSLSLKKAKVDDETTYPWEIGLSKDAIAKYCKLEGEKHPHRAINGVDHLLLCYKHLVGFPLQNKH
jgi:oligoribonuclease